MTDANKAPSYPWYPRDFAADEPVQLMTLAEEGAYRRLLDHQWLHGSIPGEIHQLAAICKNVAVPEMRKIWPNVEGCFEKMPGLPVRLRNRKLERVRLDREAFIAHAREAGKRGGDEASRRRREKEDEHSNPTSDPATPATNLLVAKQYPAVATASATAVELPSVSTKPADAAENLDPHSQQSCMRLVVERLYLGRRPLDRDMATNGSLVRNFARQYGFDGVSRIIEGLALRRDRGELYGVGPNEVVSLKWVNSAKMDLNQLAVCEDAFYRSDPEPRRGRGNATEISQVLANITPRAG